MWESLQYEWISNMKITKQQLKQIIKEELEGLQDGIVRKPFGNTMITHDDYEQSDEPRRDDTGEPPLTQRSQRKLDHNHMMARINDAKLYLQQQDDPVASELSQELDGVIYTMELLSDYFMGDMPFRGQKK